MSNKNTLRLEIPECFEFLLEPHRTKVSYGGRGGAKSWAYARTLLALAMSSPLRILCAREVQKSIKESVHQLLADQIEALGLGYHYEVLQTEIKAKNGGRQNKGETQKGFTEGFAPEMNKGEQIGQRRSNQHQYDGGDKSEFPGEIKRHPVHMIYS